MTLTVAIIGRPNVGKSTLFNRLVGRRVAIVDDTPGVTRDRREAPANLGGLEFTVIDTAGLEEVIDDSLEARMRAQTERALDDADVALLLIDARAGVTPLDSHFADWLRRRATPVVLLANKCESGGGDAGVLEAYALGLGDPVPISAEHGEGMGLIYDVLAPFAEPEPAEEDGDEDEDRAETDEAAAERPIQLAIVGRPNVGKSTLVNRLLGEDRVLTSPEAGTTRDAIAIPWSAGGRTIHLVDTAGLRRKARVTERLEGLSASDSLKAIRFAQVVVLLLDAREAMEKQDLTIASLVIEEGRALVIGLNKWDDVADREAALKRLGDRLQTSLPQVRGVPVLTLSALTGRGVEALLPAVLAVYETWNRRVPTGPLNRWLAEVDERHPPPVSHGRRVRLRYITQAKTRPPTFIIFVSRPEALPDSYLRYLMNGLRKRFDLAGIPLRLLTRKGDNPYAKKSR